MSGWGIIQGSCWKDITGLTAGAKFETETVSEEYWCAYKSFV